MPKSKILIIEDDYQVQQIYDFKLQQSGFTVRVANNGEEGLAAAEEFLPELLLVDLRMPVMNGDEMLEILRGQDWGADMRVVILTNISKDEAPRNLRLLGVDRYIVKAHTTPAEVVRIAQEVLGQKSI